MAEYIERDEVLSEIDDMISNIAFSSPYQSEIATLTSGMERARDCVENAESADVAPVVHGRWEQTKEWETKAKYRCSVCGREIMSAVKVNIEKYPYCHCGAKMDGDG